MSVSLTKKEFLERFDERRNLFIMAINHDLTCFKSKIRTDIKYNSGNSGKPEVQVAVNDFANELVEKAVSRAINLVYQDMD